MNFSTSFDLYQALNLLVPLPSRAAKVIVELMMTHTHYNRHKSPETLVKTEILESQCFMSIIIELLNIIDGKKQ